MSKRNHTATLDRYDEAIRDVLEFVHSQGCSINHSAKTARVGTSFLAGADLACHLIYDGVRSGLARGFARRCSVPRKVGHA